jgi:hypothetical protein
MKEVVLYCEHSKKPRWLPCNEEYMRETKWRQPDSHVILGEMPENRPIYCNQEIPRN